MEQLFSKVLEMLKESVEERRVSAESFSREYTNNGYSTDGIELQILKGKAYVKVKNAGQRELTEEEYAKMFDTIFEGEECALQRVEVTEQIISKSSDEVEEVDELDGTESILLEANNSFGENVVEEVENYSSNTNLGDLEQLSLF